MLKRLLVMTLSVCCMVRAAVLENSHVRMTFSDKTGNLTEIQSKQTGRSVPLKGECSLWRLLLVTEEGVNAKRDVFVQSTPQISVVRNCDEQVMTLKWTQEPCVVTVTVALPDGSGIASWRAEAFVNGTDAKPAAWISELIFPNLDNLGSFGDDKVIYGEQLGRQVRHPNTRMRPVKIHSPGAWSMQFFALFGSAKKNISTGVGGSMIDGFQRADQEDETGLFVAADDGDGYHKELRMDAGANQTFSARIANFPPYPFWPIDAAKRPATFSYKMPYSIKMGAYKGGQSEAAELYRNIALYHKYIKDAGPLASEKNPLSESIKNNVFWGKIYYGADKITPEVLAWKDYLNVPMSVQWYRFNVNVFDDNNINYFPTHNHFREGIDALKKAGIGVAPYVCCAVFDPDTESYTRWNVDDAKTLDEALSPHIWWLNHQPSFYMNPAAKSWRDAYCKVTMKLFGQWGTDGQYLDCMASMGILDYSGKNNKPNGGNYFAQGNRKLLEEMREQTSKVTDNPFIISEGFNENYIGGLDAFLMLDITRYGWALNRTHEVIPLMSHVYHDYAVPYGSDCNQQIENLDEFRWNMGLSFAWGMQLCYSTRNIETPGSKPHDLYTKDLAQAWYRVANKFLNGGRYIPIAQIPKGKSTGVSAAVLETAAQTVNANFDFSKQTWYGPAVVGSVWAATDSTLGVTMANLTDKPQPAKLTLRKDKLPKAKGDVIWQSWPLPAKKIGTLKAETNLSLNVPANGCMVLEIRDSSAPEVKALPSVSHKNFLADGNGVIKSQDYSDDLIYGCDAAWIRFEKGKLSVCQKPNGVPMRVLPYEWKAAEGRGGPRHKLNRTFYVAKPSNCRLTKGNGVWSANLFGDVLAVSLNLESGKGVVKTSDKNAVLYAINEESGEIAFAEKGELKLKKGKYRIVSYNPEGADWQRLANASLAGLATISKQAAAAGAKLLQGGDDVNAKARFNGERALALGNAIAWSVTGEYAACKMDDPHDQIILGREDKWEFTPAENGKLQILNANRAATAKAAKAGDAFTIVVDDVDAAQSLLRMLFTAEKNVKGETFAMTALKYIEVIEPIIPEIDYKQEQVVKGDLEDQVSITMETTNVSPFTVPVTVSATSLPKGWSFPEDKNEMRFEMKPFTIKKQTLFFKQDGVTPQENTQKFEVGINYTDKPLTLLHEKFVVINRNTKVAALNPNAKRPAQPSWTGGTRDEVLVAFPAGTNEKQVAIEFRPHPMGDRTIKQLKCVILDRKLRPVKTEIVKFDGVNPSTLTLDLPKDEALMVRVESTFFQLRVHAAQYGFSAWRDTRFHVFARQKTTFYFKTNKGAKELLLGAQDGGPLEIATITVCDADGKEVYRYRGNASEGEPTRIPIAAGQDNKIWSITLEPVEDFYFWFEDGASPWASLDKECVIKEVK